MAFKNVTFCNQLRQILQHKVPFLNVLRLGHVLRGKPPGIARTLEQRLKEENQVDPELTRRVDIGFPRLQYSRSEQVRERMKHLKLMRSNKELEKKARNHELLIDLDQVAKDSMQTTRGYDLRVIADHYGVFEDLFGLAYFIPRVHLNIQYNIDGDVMAPVYNGNVIKPLEARNAPLVNFDATTDPITGKPTKKLSYWCLLATNPDCHILNGDGECWHWFIGNVPGNDVTKGETLIEYLAPFPPKGIGFQRFIYILFKQDKILDFTDYKLATTDYNNLNKRTYKTVDFYRKFQDYMTPAGLAFYQTDYDKSITKFFHDVLNMKEPIYEYDFPDVYLADQKYFPLRKAFNLYLDRYRDPKAINKEYLERKLAKTHPFNGPEPELRFPNAHPLKNMPSWLMTELRKQRLKLGRINDY